MAVSSTEGMLRFSGLYGVARRASPEGVPGPYLGDVTAVEGAVEIGRIEVPLVGRNRVGYKRGRESREGTMRIQKMDTRWEMEVQRALALTLEDRRAVRDGRATGPAGGLGSPFNLHLVYDDPDALGIEEWVLSGVLLWRLPLGFSMGEELVEREYPITWESEVPFHAFHREDVDGKPTGIYYEELGSRRPT